MKINKLYAFLLFTLYFLGCHLRLHCRSVHRPKDIYDTPQISVCWAQHPKESYILKDSHLEIYPLFQIFDRDFFTSQLLPDKPISFRYDPLQSAPVSKINQLINELLQEIRKKKRSYKNFTVLSQKNFNRKKGFGMMVLKFNSYPFILKLCIETPKTFVSPYGKGIDNIWFFPMGGGINRHLAGFTRIKNLEVIKEKLVQDPQWASLIDTPRKWYWTSPKEPWIKITGYNLGGYKEISTEIPGTYAIIADAIEVEKKLTLFDKDYTKITMNLCNYLDHWIDSHIDNFMIEKNTHKIVIVDTEHFPTVVGIKEHVNFDNYLDWFVFLAGKCLKDWFFRTKKERFLAQTKPNQLALI